MSILAPRELELMRTTPLVVQIVQIPIVPGKTMNDGVGDFLLFSKTFFCVECGAQRSKYM